MALQEIPSFLITSWLPFSFLAVIAINYFEI
jgi:hypothetical protein